MLRKVVGALCLLLATSGAVAQTAAPAYIAKRSIAIADGRWDLASYDAAHDQIYIARGDAVTVVDLKTSSARNIGSIAGGHAALAIPGTNIIAVTSGQDDSLRLLDAVSGKETARIGVGHKPDAAIWDARTRRLLVMNGDSGTVSVVDPIARRVTQTIMVKPALELPALIGPDLLAINNEDANELEWVDLHSGRALAPLPLTGCEGPTGLAYDAADHLSLSACANGVAALVDARRRKVLQLLHIGAGPDGALYDPKHRRFLVPCGRSGTMSVFDVGKGGSVAARGEVPTEVSARTAAIDQQSGRVFLPSAEFQPAKDGQRPQAVAGSAHLLVFAPT